MAAKHLSGDAPDELPGQGGTGGVSGEVNTASNVGTGDGVFKEKVGVDLLFKTLKAGANVTITPDADELLIAASSGGVTDGDKGDITVSSGGTAWSVDDGVISNAKLAAVPTATIKGRATAGDGAPEDLTSAQATALLNSFTAGAKGLAPASGGGTTNFLRADGAWAAPSSSGGLPSATAVGLLIINGEGQTFSYSGGVRRQLTLTNVLANPSGFYNVATGRYTPTIPGYYQVSGSVGGLTSSGVTLPSIRVNGVERFIGGYYSISSVGQVVEVNGTVFLNGTTDYLELWAQQSGSGTTVAQDGGYNRLSCHLIATT